MMRDPDQIVRDQADRLLWMLTTRHQQDPDTWAAAPALAAVVTDWRAETMTSRLAGVRAAHQLFTPGTPPDLLDAASPWTAFVFADGLDECHDIRATYDLGDEPLPGEELLEVALIVTPLGATTAERQKLLRTLARPHARTGPPRGCPCRRRLPVTPGKP